ncbi:class I SAM-dependent methyltransferase [Maritalea mobilis]|uniref:class I SAM-dependent methyltransferase n=1 Tax=Maritalea mobilis TaxID=483324 RepID=UPI001C974F99|nr:class I SAM-dependent methyltransferase [Maritalea mobilis]MBY6201412.1 class I SAM-dependent methyltransferase [Maritalea mobilis]
MPSDALAGAIARLTSDRPNSAQASAPTNWSAYATAYDMLAEYNPAYQELVQDFAAFLSTIEAPDLVYDIGGGTGNYTQVAARSCPASEIRFVEPDDGMMSAARSKLAGHPNIAFDGRPFEAIDAAGAADLVICVHALYAMPQPEQRLRDLARLLRPGGWLYLIDLGRYLDVAEWRGYLFDHLRKEHGLFNALRIAWQARQIARQNKAILTAQKKGIYWTHSEAEIASLVTSAGLQIHRQQPVYRGYSDLLICTKPGSTE